MALSCEPSDLIASAKCFDCIPKDMQSALQTYLLAVIAGGSLDPSTLLAEAKCFQFTEEIQQRIQTYLLCQIANK